MSDYVFSHAESGVMKQGGHEGPPLYTPTPFDLLPPFSYTPARLFVHGS